MEQTKDPIGYLKQRSRQARDTKGDSCADVFATFRYRTLLLEVCAAAFGPYMGFAGVAMTSINPPMPANSISSMKWETSAATRSAFYRTVDKKRFRLTKCADSWTKPSRLPALSCPYPR